MKKLVSWQVQSDIKGVTLMELLIVITTIGMLTFLLASIPNSLALISRSDHISIAREIAVKQVDDRRAMPYDNLQIDENGVDIVDYRMSRFPNGVGKVYIKPCDIQVCPSDEQVKQITVSISWTEAGQEQNVEITTLISENGLGY
jgi:competence protein ComGC